MNFIIDIFFIFSGLIFLFLFLGIIRTFFIQKSKLQKKFLEGTLPSRPLEGFYQGRVSIKTNWQGKSFDSSSKTGINVLKNSSSQEKKFPFKTYEGEGLQDKKLKVLKIDYDIKQNPFYIRLVLDEIVQVGDNSFLGKANYKLIPGFPFCLGFFELHK